MDNVRVFLKWCHNTVYWTDKMTLTVRFKKQSVLPSITSPTYSDGRHRRPVARYNNWPDMANTAGQSPAHLWPQLPLHADASVPRYLDLKRETKRRRCSINKIITFWCGLFCLTNHKPQPTKTNRQRTSKCVRSGNLQDFCLFVNTNFEKTFERKKPLAIYFWGHE